jgi:F-type H+-transporting ATPase subunit epsilon
MNLKVLLPTGVLIEEEVTKVIAEAHNGFFCLLPKHVDFAAAIVPGILSFETAGGREEFLAVDQGILIKCGQEVLVSTRNAVRGPDLGQLRRTVEIQGHG